MINENNKRVIITMTKNQAKSIEKLANENNISFSKMCNKLIFKNLNDLKCLPQEDLQEIIRIAKTPWINQ